MHYLASLKNLAWSWCHRYNLPLLTFSRYSQPLFINFALDTKYCLKVVKFFLSFPRLGGEPGIFFYFHLFSLSSSALDLLQGTLTGGRITKWFDLLKLQDLLARNQLHFSKQQNFSFWKQPSLNQQGQEVSCMWYFPLSEFPASWLLSSLWVSFVWPRH